MFHFEDKGMSYEVAMRIAKRLFWEQNIPLWVNKNMFYAHKARDIQLMMREAMEDDAENVPGTEQTVSFACCEHILTGFVSDEVDVGASGGFDGKYRDTDVTFNVHTGLHQ